MTILLQFGYLLLMRTLNIALSVLLAAILIVATIGNADAANLQQAYSGQGSNQLLNTLPKQAMPLELTASFLLSDLNYINDETETFDFTGFMKLTWHDPRQAFDPTIEGVAEKMYIGDYQFNEVYNGWWPQLVLVNESGMYETGGVMLRILPDGTLILFEKINGTAKTHLNLRRYPFDTQQLVLYFTVLGFDRNEVLIKPESGADTEVTNKNEIVRIPQWHLNGIKTAAMERMVSVSGHEKIKSTYVVSMDMKRKPFFFLRLVVIPMIIIVVLSWSVFWMDKSTVGDRINVSFIGILTAVAYQLVLGDTFPHISYVTLMNGFVNISFLVVCASVFINLRVGYLDRSGKPAAGDQLDRRCRLLFPVIYFCLLLLTVITVYLLPSPV